MRKVNYKRIYIDLLTKKYPEKLNKCKPILEKERVTTLEVLQLNQIIFEDEDKETFCFNQSHRAYDKETILEILNYQKKNNLNNTQLSAYLKLSRNTVTKWRRLLEL